MGIEDLLKRLGNNDPDAVREIAKNLNLLPPITDCKLGFLISSIVGFLKKPTGIEKIHIPTSAMDSLEAYLIRSEEIPNEQKKNLQKYGFVIDNNVPHEIEVYFKPRWIQKYSVQLPAKTDPITPSAFLKLHLLVEYLECNGSIKLHNKRNGKTFAKQYNKLNDELMIWENRDILLGIIDYLEIIKSIEWQKNVLNPNTSNILDWRKRDKHQVLKHFYEKMFIQLRTYELPELIKEMSDVNALDMKWVNRRFFKKNQLKNVHTAVKLGLIRDTKNGDDTLLQLTPEGSFYINGNVPPQWIENNMIISADYELHIPYNHDPFLIAKLYSMLEMVNNEFFIVFRAEPEKIKNKRELLMILDKYGRRIPDVLRHEFG